MSIYDPVVSSYWHVSESLLISNKENLTRLSLLKTQTKMKSAKLLKTWMFAKLFKVVAILQKS